ncbi:hypothetical protein Barb4_01693 [Bacteroidales bacterium Barb4]|nr:hypothetical protein Barb4_01693 [Bacteroidales bacterium Barb4]
MIQISFHYIPVLGRSPEGTRDFSPASEPLTGFQTLLGVNICLNPTFRCASCGAEILYSFGMCVTFSSC